MLSPLYGGRRWRRCRGYCAGSAHIGPTPDRNGNPRPGTLTAFGKVADRPPHRFCQYCEQNLLHGASGWAKFCGVRQARANHNQGRGTTVAPLKSTIKRAAPLAAVGAVLVVSALVASSLLLHRRPAVSESPNTTPSPSRANAPRTLSELLALKPDKLEGTDIALMNLLCAEGLPGAKGLNVRECLVTLDQWAQHASREIDRNYHHFREDPAYYYHSEAFYRMLMLAVVVYEDFGIRYNPKWIASPSEIRGNDHFFADSRDILVHGLVGPERMGTCSSMPVIYIALGRRLGYPLKLVTTKAHLFIRWDSPLERFDLEATGKGMNYLAGAEAACAGTCTGDPTAY